jgi:hypothetical protein
MRGRERVPAAERGRRAPPLPFPTLPTRPSSAPPPPLPRRPLQRSNNRRALWYTVLEVLVLAGMGAFNVYVVRDMFKGFGARLMV